MMPHQNEKRSQLFTLRVWSEETSEGHTEWRGRIQHVVGGETRYFHDWEAMMAFLVETLEIPGAIEGNAKGDSHN
jgi:hypothetical protein